MKTTSKILKTLFSALLLYGQAPQIPKILFRNQYIDGQKITKDTGFSQLDGLSRFAALTITFDPPLNKTPKAKLVLSEDTTLRLIFEAAEEDQNIKRTSIVRADYNIQNPSRNKRLYESTPIHHEGSFIIEIPSQLSTYSISLGQMRAAFEKKTNEKFGMKIIEVPYTHADLEKLAENAQVNIRFDPPLSTTPWTSLINRQLIVCIPIPTSTANTAIVTGTLNGQTVLEEKVEFAKQFILILPPSLCKVEQSGSTPLELR